MAFQFMDGFDHYTSCAEMVGKWDTASSSASIATGRNGNALYRTNMSYEFTKVLTAAQSWYIGFAWKSATAASAARPIFTLYRGTTAHFSLCMASDGLHLQTRRGTETGTLLHTSDFVYSQDVWYYIEVYVKIADAGEYQVKINGVSDANMSSGGGPISADTQNGSDALADLFSLKGTSASAAGTHYIDDLYVIDSSGSTNNSWLGDCRVETVVPSGAGNSTQWTPSSGSNWAAVDEVPPVMTDYVETTTATNKDTYALGNIATTSGTVYAVQTNTYAQKTDAGARTMHDVLRYSTNESSGATYGLSDTAQYYSTPFDVPPGGGTWDITKVNGLEAGFELDS